MPRPRTKPEPPRVLAEGACAHHWLIEPAKGATSKGVCRLCGESRQFNNSGGVEYVQGATAQKDGKPKMPDLTLNRRPARWNDGF